MKWKNGRPDGWKNPHLKPHSSSILPTECKCWYCTEWRAYEAGADAYAKAIYEWGNGVCSHGTSIDGRDFIMRLRRECYKCWQALYEEIK